jgi:catechol 2,3-dioxygenase-like lactoylglutathione lyase family enzyme
MIRGVHSMFYSTHADELRAFFRDKLGLSAVDIGEGWLIFNPAEADLGVHPTEAKARQSNDERFSGEPPSGTTDVSFYCDDVETTVAELTARGVEFTRPIEDHGYGLATFFKAPGDFEIQLYQPKYAK